MEKLFCVAGLGDIRTCECGKEFQQAVSPWGLTDCCSACWEARRDEYDRRHPDEVARRRRFAALRDRGRWA